jgi:hypothetical protein
VDFLHFWKPGNFFCHITLGYWNFLIVFDGSVAYLCQYEGGSVEVEFFWGEYGSVLFYDAHFFHAFGFGEDGRYRRVDFFCNLVGGEFAVFLDEG